MKELSRTQEKTFQRFLDAFFAVRNVKSLDKITVKDLVTAAGYNRSSFYLYFTDVYDLASAAEDHVLAQLSDAAAEQFSQDGPVMMEDFMQNLVMRASAYAERISLLADSRSFRDKFMDLLRPTFARATGLDSEMRGYDYLISLFFSIMLHNISYWSRHREDVDLPELAEMTRTVFLPGILRLQAEK